jgi:hypothetical protein
VAEIEWEDAPKQKIEWEDDAVEWESEETTLVNDVMDAFVYAGKSMKHGFDVSASHMFDLAANIPMMLNEAGDYLDKQMGIKDQKTVLKTVEQWLRNQAEYGMPSEEQAPKDIIGKVYSGIGAAPATLATYLPAVKGLGAVKGMAATEALAAAEEGPGAALEAGAKGALIGGTLKAVEPLARTARVPAMAAVGATQAAAEGGDVTDIVSGGIVMGGLGALGAKEGLRFKDLKKINTPDLPAKALIEPTKAESIVENAVKAEVKAREFAGNINLDKITTTESVKQSLKDVSKQYDQFNKARRGVVSHEETKRLADDLGLTVDKLLERRRGQAFNAHEALAARELLVTSGDKLTKLAERAQGGSDADLMAVQAQLTRHVAIQEQVAGMTAEAGRALNQFKIQAKSSKAKLQVIQDIVESHGGRKQIEKIAEALADPANVKNINKLSRKLQRPKPSDMALELWINSLLSGPQTHAVNMTSNAAIAIWSLPENLIAAGLGKLHKGDKVLFGDVAARGYGFIEGAKEGLKRAGETIRTGEPVDPMSKLEMARNKAIPGKVGEAVRLPGRFLMAEDELFKSIGYRMELNSQAYRTAAKEGLKGRDFAKRIEELKVSPTEAMHLKATETARYQTFTKPLGPIGRGVQSVASAHPSIKLIMPFIRTPVNIVKYAGERTPFSVFSKEVRDTLKKGGAERDQQLAKIAMGTMVSSTAAALVAENMLTGGGPSDPRQKAALYATGWQPYSVKIGDKYHSYARIEPLGMLLGISADAAEIAGKMETKEADKVGAMVFGSVSKNLTSKTFLKGISEVLKAIDDPDRYGERWVQNYAGTVIPSAVSQTARVVDPVLRESRSVIDKIKSRIPYISKSLLPRRNLWGEPITLEGGLGPDIVSPIYQGTAKHDKVANEIVDLGLAPAMPLRKISGIELTPDQYDDYVIAAGKPAKKVLDTLVNDSGWDNYMDHQKAEIISTVIDEYKNQGRNEILVKYPELIQEIIKARIEKQQ